MQYSEKRKESNKRAQQAWRERNPELHKQQALSWKKRNPDKVREQKRRYREKHADVIKLYREKNIDKIKENANKRRRERRDFLADYKSRYGCFICEEKESCCLDFHHVNGEDKGYTMASLRMYSIETMMIEIQKCIVLCANCHRKFHAGIIFLESEKLHVTS